MKIISTLALLALAVLPARAGKFYDNTANSSSDTLKVAGNIEIKDKALPFGASTVKIDGSSGTVGIGSGAAAAAAALDVSSAYLDANGAAVKVNSTQAQAAGTGGKIAFYGNYTNAGGNTTAAMIGASKDNSTDANFGFGITFQTRPNGGALTEGMKLASDGGLALSSASANGMNFLGAWATFTPSWTGFSVNPTATVRYMRIGKLVFMNITTAVAGTSNSTALTMTLPIAGHTGDDVYGAVTGINNTSLTSPAMVFISGTTCNFYTTWASGGWIASGSKYVEGNFWYEAN